MLPSLLLLPLAAWGVTAKKCAKVFDLTLTWETYAPNGREREMILVNGQFPAPALEINEGDLVEVNVHNELPFESSVHFHGIEMLHTPWSDGVAGLTQRPIPSGSSFKYKWKATQHGSHWYHAHLKGQIEDGLYGPIRIQPKKDRQKPFSLISSDSAAIHAMESAEKKTKPVVLSDFRHMTSKDVLDLAFEANMELTCYDSFLINGQGKSRCRSAEEIESLLGPEQQMILELVGLNMTEKACLPAEFIAMGVGNPALIPDDVYHTCKESDGGQAVISFETAPEKSCGAKDTWVSLDLIGTFNFMTAMVSIDGLDMWVYAMDGDYILPQKAHVIPVTNGDRYSVLVPADKVGDFTIRLASIAAPQILSEVATLSIREKGTPELEDEADIPTPWILDNGVPTSPDVVIFNQAVAKPYPPAPIPEKADAFHHFVMRTLGGSLLWTVNGTTLLSNNLPYDEPLLFHPPVVDQADNVTIATQSGQWVDLVFEAGEVPMPPHPMHKHGNKMYLIGHGEGSFEWASVAEAAEAQPELFNLVDPPRRDAFSTPNAAEGPAWMAVRYHVENPGPWLLHCHIQNHMSGGMSIIILDGVDAWPEVPEEYLNYRG